jgi:SAM-dependent methyltransferase
MKNFVELKNCRSCNSKNMFEIIDFKESPWCNNFTKDGTTVEKYPLKLMKCTDCSLVQLSGNLNKMVMFSDNTYVSGTTKTLASHFYDIAEKITKKHKIEKSDLIIDIGGNDGTNLLQYKKLGFDNLLNVESATNIAYISIKNGIPTMTNFFNETFIDNLINSMPKKEKARVINASGVFFHLEELHSVIRGIKKILASDGVFIVQFMYLGDIVENCAFDAIYHEHLCYYTLESLSNLLNPYGLKIYSAHSSPIHGGSVIAEIGFDDLLLEEDIPESLLKKDDVNYDNFSTRVEHKKNEIKNFLLKLKSEGKTIWGYGAPAKSTTLLNYCKIDDSILDKTVEVNTLKVGLRTPGTNIPIELEDKNNLPDYYFVLAWNFIDEIIKKKENLVLIFPLNAYKKKN